MNIEYLIQLLGNRLIALGNAKEQAFLSGDLERINTLDGEFAGVVDTLNKLKLLEGISQTAAVTPFTEAQVVQNGIEASFNPTVVNDTTECLLKYNIAPYATDPYHEIKIQNILENMGLMDSPDKIEFYIKKTNPDSPLNGIMVWNASQQYAVDARLVLALMELDSRFGTVGVAVRTLNPGNVGNDGTNTKTYSSWEEGVAAVAAWLNRHRIAVAPTAVAPEVVATAQVEPVVNPPAPVVAPDVPVVEVPLVDPVVEAPTVVTPEVITPPVENPVVDTITTPVSEVPAEIPSVSDPIVSTIKNKKNSNLS
ncbi:MAG: hypothetical protein NTU81_02630 [Candidatus Nomurabacteria bacterium]|nr:hypothetical protein [Candidatus Nomurabacteria bacterium]